MYNGYIHSRSINSTSHESRDWVRGLWGKINWEIPNDWRICGENMFAKHTVPYNQLNSYFLAFSIWNSDNYCLNWEETLAYLDILGLEHVPVIYDGIYDEGILKGLDCNGVQKEGWVIRNCRRVCI